jgi:hypothetical protein
MFCKSCQSEHQATFVSDINIHFPRPSNLSKESVWAFPVLIICLDCGFAEMQIGKVELCLLNEGIGAQEQAA